MNLCACDNEELQREVGADVNVTILFDTLQVVGLAETVRTVIRLDYSLPGGHDTVSCVAITTFPQLDNDMTIVYYETIKRNLNKRLIYECRCDERLKGKSEGSTCLTLGCTRDWKTKR
jgi:hypothetical protein